MSHGAAWCTQSIQHCILLTFSRFILLCQKHKKYHPPQMHLTLGVLAPLLIQRTSYACLRNLICKKNVFGSYFRVT